MHFGQMGFEQTRHCSSASSPGCLRHRGGVPGSGASISGCLNSGAEIRTRNGADADAAAAVCCEEDRISNPGDDAGVSPIGLMLITRPPGVVFCPNSCRISPSTNSHAYAPQAGQTNLTGLVRISGVISKACLAPHEHCTFIMPG